MATYGLDRYGLSYYGNGYDTQFQGYLRATPVSYGAILLDLAAPAKRASSTSTTDLWSTMMVVRNPLGFPVDPDDGDPVIVNTTGAGLSGPDANLIEGTIYYYSMFVKDTALNLWRRSADAYALSVKNFNSTEIMWEALPYALRISDRAAITSGNDNNDLYNFISLLAFEYDLEKTQAYLMTPALDATKISHHFLPALMSQFGFQFENSLGYQRSRSIVTNALEIYNKKGSIQGLLVFIKAMTGYDATIVNGKNLLLDYNTASFEESVGVWALSGGTSGGTLSVVTSTVIAPYAETALPVGFPNKQKGSLAVTSTAGGDLTLTCGTDHVLQSVPVVGSTAYSFSVRATAATTGRSITASITWYDQFGTLISTSTGTAATDTTTAWATTVSVSATSPANAVFAVPSFVISGTTTSEVHYFDAAQFEASAAPTYFEDARLVKITLIANRVNELLNPNFETAQAPWTTTNTSSTAIVTSTSPTNAHVTESGAALELYPATAAEVTLVSENIAQGTTRIVAGSSYAFSVYVMLSSYGGTPSSSDLIWASISWYDSLGTLLGTDVGSSIVGSTTTWIRPSVVSTAPTNAAYAVAKLHWTASVTTLSLIADIALFEKNAFIDSFFDGTSGFASVSDLLWEGTANSSRSHYYKNRGPISARLVQLLPEYLPLDSPFSVFYAQP